MKGMKKLLSILMVLTLVLSLGATAFASTVTIGEGLEGHSFTAYKIFSGSQDDADDNMPLGNVTWGGGVNPAGFVAALRAMPEFTGKLDDVEETNPDAAKVAAAIGEVAGNTSNSEIAKKIADAAAANLQGSGTPIEGGSTVLDDGYYLIKDTTEKIEGQDAYNDVVLQVTEDVTVNYKTDVPTSDKSVKDINDTDDGDISDDPWGKSADHDIGDHVPFQLKGTLPSNYGDYTEYYLAFHDVEDDGLSFDSGSVKVYVDNVLISAGYEVKTSGLDDGCTFEVVFDDMKDVLSAHAGSVITVEYTAELTEDCVIGNPGNHNKSQMEFSNDSHSDSHGKTPEVTVVVFTYDLNVDKIDENNEPLSGAEFKLYKVDKNGKTDVSEVDQLKDKLPAGTKLTEVELEMDAEKDSFYGKGLDDGEYWIVETVTPPGYNTIDPKSFTVSAEHDTLVTTLNGTADWEFKLERAGGDHENALGQTDIQNLKGVELPETGGIGTTIFYIAGAVLAAGAVILLVTKKRLSGNAEK